MKKRVTYLDLAKGFGVFLVMLGHLQGDSIFSFSPYILPLCSWIFSFHMALFFIISGMLVNLKNEIDKDFSQTVNKKFKAIMIPYFWFSLIYFLIVLYTFFFKDVLPLKTVFLQLYYVIGMYGMNVLWFLPALFTGELLFIFICKKASSYKRIILIIILAILGILINYFRNFLPDTLPIYERINELIITLIRPLFICSYVAIGYYIFSGIRFIEEKIKNTLPIEGLLVIVSLIINIFLCKINGPVDFRSLVMNNYVFYYICATLGSVFLILLCKILSRVYCFPIFTFFGRNSLCFMAVHNNSAVLTLGLTLSMYVNQYLTRARGYISYAIVVLTITIYITITILLINKFVPFIVGKKKAL